jgi:hypothetical protein
VGASLAGPRAPPTSVSCTSGSAMRLSAKRTLSRRQTASRSGTQHRLGAGCTHRTSLSSRSRRQPVVHGHRRDGGAPPRRLWTGQVLLLLNPGRGQLIGSVRRSAPQAPRWRAR